MRGTTQVCTAQAARRSDGKEKSLVSRVVPQERDRKKHGGPTTQSDASMLSLTLHGEETRKLGHGEGCIAMGIGRVGPIDQSQKSESGRDGGRVDQSSDAPKDRRPTRVPWAEKKIARFKARRTRPAGLSRTILCTLGQVTGQFIPKPTSRASQGIERRETELSPMSAVLELGGRFSPGPYPRVPTQLQAEATPRCKRPNARG